MAESVLQLTGGKELEKLLATFPGDVAKLARRRGVRRAAAKLRTKLRKDAPSERATARSRSVSQQKKLKRGKDPTLFASIKVKNGKFRSWVGLATRYYYETLDLQTARGAPLRPWFEASARRHAPEAGQLIVRETNKAIAFEAGKAYRRSLENVRRRRRRTAG